MRSRLFIGSATESLSVANATQQNLYHDAEVTVWSQGVFGLSATALDSLIHTLDTFDFAVFVLSPDDLVTIRGDENQAVRDNVIFELGLFIGHLGKDRCFLLLPQDNTDLRVPTDLIGITPAEYETNRTDGNLQAATGPACTSIREAIGHTGPRDPQSEAPGVDVKAPKARDGDETINADRQIAHHEDASPESNRFEWARAFIGRRYVEALPLLDEQISLSTDVAELPFLETWATFVRSRIDSKNAAADFQRLVNKYPTYPEAYTFFADQLMEQNRHPDCLLMLDRGLSKVSHKSPLLRSKARCLGEMGRDGEAVNTLREGITQFPQDSGLCTDLAEHYIQRGDYPAARLCLEEALQAIPVDESLLSVYAKLLSDHFDNKLALIPYNQLLALSPENSTYLTLRANVYLSLDLNDLAMRDYIRASELKDNQAAWILANIGNLYNNRGFHTEAVRFLNKALNIDPASQYAHDRLASSIKLQDEQAEKLVSIVREARRDILSLPPTTDAPYVPVL